MNAQIVRERMLNMTQVSGSRMRPAFRTTVITAPITHTAAEYPVG